MKVLHLTHTDINKDPRVIKAIKVLEKFSWAQVSGIGIKHSGSYARQFDITDSFSANTHNLILFFKQIPYVPKVFRHPLLMLEFLFKATKIIKQFRPSVLHCHDTLVLPIALFSKLLNPEMKIIYDAHELESDRNSIGLILSNCVYLFEKISWRYLDHFISVSPSIIKWYEEEFGPKPSSLILNSPKLNPLGPDKELKGFREKFKVADHEKLFIYVGEISVGRGIDNLLKIFKDTRSRILFLGYGPLVEKVKEHEKNFLNIHYHETVEHNQLVNLIKEADVGICFVENVSLSDYYCLPNKLFEYAFAGLPILASDFPDIKSVINQYDLGSYCSIDSLEVMKKKIEEFENMKVIPKRDVSKLYDISWQRQELELERIYKSFRDFSHGSYQG